MNGPGNAYDKLNISVVIGDTNIQCCVNFVYEELEYSKGVIKICISKKNRQYNGLKRKYKRTNNDLQHIHIKLKNE